MQYLIKVDNTCFDLLTDQEFWNCLVLGTRLRDAYTWIALSNGDLDGEAMDRWVTDHLFGSTANHRCT